MWGFWVYEPFRPKIRRFSPKTALFLDFFWKNPILAQKVRFSGVYGWVLHFGTREKRGKFTPSVCRSSVLHFIDPRKWSKNPIFSRSVTKRFWKKCPFCRSSVLHILPAIKKRPGKRSKIRAKLQKKALTDMTVKITFNWTRKRKGWYKSEECNYIDEKLMILWDQLRTWRKFQGNGKAQIERQTKRSAQPINSKSYSSRFMQHP